MAYNEKLALRVSEVYRVKRIKFTEKKMFGGICHLVKDKMCTGIVGEKLMVRLDPEIYEDSLKKKGCEVMDFSGKPMKGFVFVSGSGIATRKALESWIQKALDFNPKAVSSKKK